MTDNLQLVRACRVLLLCNEVGAALHELGGTDPMGEKFASRDLALANTHIEDAVLRILRHVGVLDTTKIMEAVHPSSVPATGMTGPEAPPPRANEVRAHALTVAETRARYIGFMEAGDGGLSLFIGRVVEMLQDRGFCETAVVHLPTWAVMALKEVKRRASRGNFDPVTVGGELSAEGLTVAGCQCVHNPYITDVEVRDNSNV